MEDDFQKNSIGWWPTTTTEEYDGWTLAYAQGYSAYSNSAHIVTNSHIALSEKLSFCEGWFRKHKVRSSFLLRDTVASYRVDSFLEKAHYRSKELTLVMVLSSLDSIIPRENGGGLYCSGKVSLIKDSSIFQAFSKSQQQIVWQLLFQNRENTIFATIKEGEAVIATGFGVVEGTMLVLYDIYVAPKRREQGYGTLLLYRLLGEGKRRGCREASLQVRANNLAAQNLYRKIGFQERYHFWYRVKDF